MFRLTFCIFKGMFRFGRNVPVRAHTHVPTSIQATSINYIWGQSPRSPRTLPDPQLLWTGHAESSTPGQKTTFPENEFSGAVLSLGGPSLSFLECMSYQRILSLFPWIIICPIYCHKLVYDIVTLFQTLFIATQCLTARE